MDLKQTMAELKKLADEQTLKTWKRHGATGEVYGVKIGNMKKLLKKIKGRQDLALELYATGNLDAMYMAGLLADGGKMSKKELKEWATAARWQMIAEYTVPWVAAESPHGRELALEWMDAKPVHLAAAGWNTYSGLVSIKPDDELDLKEVEKLLTRAEKNMATSPDRVRYCMNGFVIAVGGAVKPLLPKAKAAAKRIGAVEVDMGDTACKVPPALGMIEKIEAMGRVGHKRKTCKC